MVIVWVKHTEKEYDNGKGPFGKPLFDPKCLQPLKEVPVEKRFFDYSFLEAVVMSEIFFSPEIEQNHHVKIISSPFARTRGTSQRIKACFEENFKIYNSKFNTNKNLKVTIEPVEVLISEYLGNQKRVKRPLKYYEYDKEVFFYKETINSIVDPNERENFPYLSETVPFLKERCRKHIEKENISDYFDKFHCFNFNSPLQNGYKEHRIYVSHGFVIKNIISEYFNSLGINVPEDINIDVPLKPLRGFALYNKIHIVRF